VQRKRIDFAEPAPHAAVLGPTHGTRPIATRATRAESPTTAPSTPDLPLEPDRGLTACQCGGADGPVEVFDWPLPVGELAVAADYLQARGVLLFSSKAINISQLPKLLNNVSCPKLIVGPTVCIHHAELSAKASEIADLHLAEDPLLAHQVLVQRGLI